MRRRKMITVIINSTKRHKCDLMPNDFVANLVLVNVSFLLFWLRFSFCIKDKLMLLKRKPIIIPVKY